MIQNEVPSLIFLMETKANLKKMKYVMNKIDFKYGLVILSEGSSGESTIL